MIESYLRTLRMLALAQYRHADYVTDYEVAAEARAKGDAFTLALELAEALLEGVQTEAVSAIGSTVTDL